jgi:hypothetical protein
MGYLGNANDKELEEMKTRKKLEEMLQESEKGR